MIAAVPLFDNTSHHDQLQQQLQAALALSMIYKPAAPCESVSLDQTSPSVETCCHLQMFWPGAGPALGASQIFPFTCHFILLLLHINMLGAPYCFSQSRNQLCLSSVMSPGLSRIRCHEG